MREMLVLYTNSIKRHQLQHEKSQKKMSCKRSVWHHCGPPPNAHHHKISKPCGHPADGGRPQPAKRTRMCISSGQDRHSIVEETRLHAICPPWQANLEKCPLGQTWRLVTKVVSATSNCLKAARFESSLETKMSSACTLVKLWDRPQCITVVNILILSIFTNAGMPIYQRELRNIPSLPEFARIWGIMGFIDVPLSRRAPSKVQTRAEPIKAYVHVATRLVSTQLVGGQKVTIIPNVAKAVCSIRTRIFYSVAKFIRKPTKASSSCEFEKL